MPAGLQVLHKQAHESHIAGLLRGDVHGDFCSTSKSIVEPFDGAHRFAEHKVGDWVDEPKLDCKTDEGSWRLDPRIVVPPGYQRLEAVLLFAANIDFGL